MHQVIFFAHELQIVVQENVVSELFVAADHVVFVILHIMGAYFGFGLNLFLQLQPITAH